MYVDHFFLLLMHVLPRCGLKIKTTPKDKETTDASKVKEGGGETMLIIISLSFKYSL